jgi:hypothetical protein
VRFRTPIPFANLLVASRTDHRERKLAMWLTKRQQYTLSIPVVDSSETPVESLDVGVLRTLARGVA